MASVALNRFSPFRWRESVICAYSDSDSAGPCEPAIALSSVKAEPCATTIALRGAKGLKPSGPEFGEDLRRRAYVDAQATSGLSHRAALGKAWHKEMADRWMQDALERQEPEIVNIGGEHNPADVLTKPMCFR